MATQKSKNKKEVVDTSKNTFVISQYYGFDAISLPDVTPEDIEKCEKIRKGSEFLDEHLPPVEENAALLRHHKEDEELQKKPLPLFIYHEGQAKGSHKKKRRKHDTVGLHIIGTPKSIAEAMLIKTIYIMLQEEGYTDVDVAINSVGNKESFSPFLRELNAYYRKNAGKMHSQCRQLLKDGPHAVVSCQNEICQELRSEAPSPLNYLTDEDKGHFSEVLEYLDNQEIPYQINKDLIGDPNYSTQTIFTITDNKTGEILAQGSRYDQLSKKITKKEMPGVTASVHLPKRKKSTQKDTDPRNSKFYLIQLGPTAKQKALSTLEHLRKAEIPVYQSLTHDRLGTQLQVARKMGFLYALVLGQKEALDDTVVVRDLKGHSQEVVAHKDLVKHLKKLK